ncbi:MAG: DegT/DnrJ/EryC1/StrS family aminotransferase [Candidatus Shapirobacteria bacterium]|nr:DegT/DnrJ/EryC1/StrS family aminotransferase [Candidatus Shapirobacteria bacterium]
MYKHIWPHISEETKKAVVKQLDTGEISIYDRSGIFKKFEDKFASHYGKKYALVISSGTAALHSAMVACKFEPGDEVICPAYTFYATVTPIFQTGAIPILCDSNTDGNMDPDKIESLITPKTRAIIITHMWGMPCKTDKIVNICKKHNLKLIEDCSHAHGAKFQNKLVGTQSDVAIFSLQGQKIITGGEGGILITDNQEIYYRALLFGHYNKRCKQEIDKNSPYYEYAVTGFGLKLRAHPLAIAIANEQFDHLTKWHQIKNENATYLSSLLNDCPFIELPKVTSEIEPSWYAYVIQVDSEKLSINTKELCNKFIENGIEDADMPGSTCPLNYLKLFQEPGFLFPQYKNTVNYKIGDFPVAEKFFNNAIKFPIDIYKTREYKKVLKEYANIIKATINDYLVM